MNYTQQIDMLAAAVIAGGMYSDPKSVNWTAEEAANDAVAVLKEIKKKLRNDSVQYDAKGNQI